MGKKRKPSGNEPTEKQLWKQLAGAPAVDVLGVLAAKGVSGGWAQGDKLWTLMFRFASWRIKEGSLKTEELHVRRKVPEASISRYQKTIKPNTVMRIRARVVENSVFGKPEALLVKVFGEDQSDIELKAEVARLQKPVKIKDTAFGTFTLDRYADWYEGKVTWNGRKVRLALSAVESADAERALQVARTLWRAQKSWHAKVLAYAVQQLLPLKNESWHDENERPLTAKQFQKRMKLDTIVVSPDGSLEFEHEDGDLFGGHSIQILGSLKKGLYDADIPG
jgi:hypothetical protein